jgi:hypothetical protein
MNTFSNKLISAAAFAVTVNSIRLSAEQVSQNVLAQTEVSLQSRTAHVCDHNDSCANISTPVIYVGPTEMDPANSNDGGLAQTNAMAFAQQDRNISHTCQSSHVMQKTTQVNFNDILNSSDRFVDETFPTSDALYWYDMGNESGEEMSRFNGQLEWKRVSEVFDSSYSLWGENGITPHDIAQGSIGNCWYLAAAAALAEYPDRLDRVVENNAFNEAGIYAFHFYALGVPYT